MVRKIEQPTTKPKLRTLLDRLLGITILLFINASLSFKHNTEVAVDFFLLPVMWSSALHWFPW